MTRESASQMFPVWASAEAVRIVDEPLPKEELPFKHRMSEKQNRFVKRYGFSLAFITALAVYSVLICMVTGMVVRRNTINEMEHQYRAQMQAYLDQQEQERRAAQFLTGGSSLNAAIDDLTKSLSVHIASLRMERNVTKRGAEVYAWVDCARLASGLYGETIDDVLSNRDNSVEGYIPGHAVRNEDTEIARKVASDFLSGKYPDRFYTGMQFAVINADGSVTARDMLFTNSKTRYWPMEGED